MIPDWVKYVEVGDQLVCIEEDIFNGLLVLGSIYTIKKFGWIDCLDIDGNDQNAFLFVLDECGDYYYGPAFFKPLTKNSMDVLEELLKTKNEDGFVKEEKVLEDAN